MIAENKTDTLQKFGFWLPPGASLILLLLTTLLAAESRAQITSTNLTVTISANGLRDRLYDACTSSALSRVPIQAAVLHLMDEATRLNPGVLSASDAAQVMQNVINGMTNDFGNSPQLTVQDFTGLALPYLRTNLLNKLPLSTVNAIQSGLSMTVVAEQQGLFSAVYSNLTTALPSGSVFSDLDNTASSLLALQRQAASQVAIQALPERIRTASETAFRDAAAQLVSQITSITPHDALATIVQTVPALRNSPLVQNLAQAANQAGQVVTDINTLVAGATNALNSLHQSVAANAGLLGQIANQQQDIIGSLSDPQVLSDSLAMARQISSDISTSIDAAQQTVTFASTMINLAGNSHLAQEVATVGGAAIKVANTVGQVADAISTAEGAFNAVGALASGNIIGAALDVFSMFGGGSSGPSPDQVILDQIGAVRQDIANLSAQINNLSAQINAGFKQLNGRFDQVDAALTNITGKIDYELSLINSDFNYVENNLGQIRSDILDLQGQVQKLESEISTWFQATDQESLYTLLHNSLGFENGNGFPMPYGNGGPEGDFISFEAEYWLWAVQNSVNGLYEPTPSGYQVSDLCTQLTTHTDPEENANYINSFIGNNLRLPQPFNGGLANPRVWSIAANGVSQMCVENPTYFRTNNRVGSDLPQIIQIGNNLNTFLNNLVAFNTNSPNTNLWISVCNQYRNSVPSFTNAVLASLPLFDTTNGYPAGFNPFTNEFLSLVTSKATNMVNGPYASASVVSVTAMACSQTPDGMPIYLLDQNTLRSLDANGMITTLAGSTNAGFRDGTTALFNNPQALVVAGDGSVYIADTGNHAIRVFGTNGLVTTLAGYLPGTNNAAPVAGAADGYGYAGLTRFYLPRALLLYTNYDVAGGVRLLLVADTGNHAIRQVALDYPGIYVSTFAGTLGMGGTRDGLTVEAASASNAGWLNSPVGVAVDSSGNAYVADSANSTIRKLVAPAGPVRAVTTIAGLAGNTGITDGTNSAARFNYPTAVAAGTGGSVYVADYLNHTIRKLTPVGTNWMASTVAGRSGTYGFADGTNAAALFDFPVGVTVDAASNLYVADSVNFTIRKITPVGTDWVVTTIAGLATRSGVADGTNSAARFGAPAGLAVDGTGNIYVADAGNYTIRKVAPAGTNWVVTTIAGLAGASGSADGVGSTARFGYPFGIAVDNSGKVYVADASNDTIRKLAPAGTNWVVTTIAGSAGVLGSGSDDGVGSAARFNHPDGVAVDAIGNVFVADTHNDTVRKLTLVGTNWVVSTIAGVAGRTGYADGTNTPIAQFLAPDGLAMDYSVGQIYVTESSRRAVRTIANQVGANGVVATYHTPLLSLLSLLLPQTYTPGSLPSYIPFQAFGGRALTISASKWSLTCLALVDTIAASPFGDTGGVEIWGRHQTGGLWSGSFVDPVAVAVGYSFSLLLNRDGTVGVIGGNNFGQLNIPAGLSGVVAVAAGTDFALALKGDGTVVAWGYNSDGECNVPAQLSGVVAVAASRLFSLALKGDGTVAAWGYNGDGECNVPAQLSGVVAVSAGLGHSLALKGDGTVAAWGYNGDGECNVPADLSGVVAISAGTTHSLALKGDGTVVAWGYNFVGECNVPAGLNNVVAVEAGGNNMFGPAEYSLALKGDGTVVAWGFNGDGQCDVPAFWSPPPQTNVDMLVASAAVPQFTAGVITPDGRVLVADEFGLRLFDYSSRIQRQAAAWLMNELSDSSSGQILTAWRLLLQNLATYGLNSALANNDALHALIFGSNADITTAFLKNVLNTPDWRPTHSDLGTTALQQIDVLQSLLLNAVQQAAPNPNPASLPLVTDTLNRLNLLLAAHGQPIPAPALSLAPGTNRTAQVFLNGYPYVHYALLSSPDMRTWTTNSLGLKDGANTTASTLTSPAKFYRALELP